jgi:hypothetical protein
MTILTQLDYWVIGFVLGLLTTWLVVTLARP